jgi:hypothetical protein
VQPLDSSIDHSARSLDYFLPEVQQWPVPNTIDSSKKEKAVKDKGLLDCCYLCCCCRSCGVHSFLSQCFSTREKEPRSHFSLSM